MEQNDRKFDALLKTITSITGFPCVDYKLKPLKRRVSSRMRALKLEDYEQYRKYLQEHKGEVEKLKTALTINVTRFLRNYDTYAFVRDNVIPYLDKIFPSIHVWSVGCASGEEPYSMAMIFEEYNKKNNIKYRILGTDIDKVSLDRARANRYNNFSMTEVPNDYLNNYFIKHKQDDEWSVKDIIRANVKFRQLNLSYIDTLNEQFEMILCRNVLIYFEKDFQINIIESIYEKLKTGGIFILGRVEMIPVELNDKFKVISKKHRIYRKV